MGLYINPKEERKEAFLNRTAKLIDEPVTITNSEEVIVCLVDNGAFTAAAVCFDSVELKEFTNSRDYRPKKWYSLNKSYLPFVTDLDDLRSYFPELLNFKEH